MNEKDPSESAAEEAKSWGLVIKVLAGSRTARERLAADVKLRNASNVDPLFTAELFRKFDGGGDFHVVTKARPRRDLIDRFMRSHRNVEAMAMLRLDRSGERHEARYAAGVRISEWVTIDMHEAAVIVLATGDPKEVARLGAVTKNPSGSNVDDPLMYAALRSCEHARETGTTFLRIFWRIPALEGINAMGEAVARAFPDLQLEFFAIPERPQLAPAQAVFRGGSAIFPWQHVDHANEVIATINKRWATLTDGQGEDLVLREVDAAHDDAGADSRFSSIRRDTSDRRHGSAGS
jgi:hypothetical protein